MKVLSCQFNHISLELEIEFSKEQFYQPDDKIKEQIESYAKKLLKILGQSRHLEFSKYIRIEEDNTVLCVLTLHDVWLVALGEQFYVGYLQGKKDGHITIKEHNAYIKNGCVFASIESAAYPFIDEGVAKEKATAVGGRIEKRENLEYNIALLNNFEFRCDSGLE